MPATVGYPKDRIGRSKTHLDMVVRARTLGDAAKQYRQSKRESAWEQSERQWQGHQWGDDDTIVRKLDDDRVTVNVSFSTINTILPYVTGSDPQFIVEPYGGKASPRNARLLEALLNRLWRSNRMAGNEHLRSAAWDFLVYGDGYLKVSYSLDEVVKSETMETATVANLWVDRVDPRDVWLDPSSDGLHNARYVAVRLFRSVEQLKQDDRYHNTSGLEGGDDRILDAQADRREQVGRRYETGNDRDKIVSVYEFYDLDARTLTVWCDQVDVPLQVVEEVECPLVQVGNHIIPACPYHMGELEQMAALQDELNKTRTQMVEHRRKNAQKWIARSNHLSTSAIAALQSQEVNAVVEVEGDRSLEDIVAPLLVPGLTADAYAIDQLIKGDVYEITGVNEYLRGASPDIRHTATEATIIEGATNVKTAQKLRVIEGAARKVGQLLLDTAAAVYPLTDADEMTMILTGRDAQAVVAAENPQADLSQVLGASLTPEPGMFEGTYEVFVEQGSTELRNPAMREQKYENMFSLLLAATPTLMRMGVQVNLRKILELWLDAAGVDDVDAILASAEQMPGQPATGPGYEGGLLGLQAAGAAGMPNEGAAMPPQAFPSPQNSGMLPPTGVNPQMP